MAIEEVETGDYALSRPDDDPDGELGFHAVTRLYRNTTDELVEITVHDVEDGVTETITTTPGHPFWVDGAWEFAAEIAPGDTLTNADGGTLTVSAATHQARHAATYNFCVDEDHTYYVGTTSTWVHNNSGPVKPYEVGTYDDLKRRSPPHDELDIHHAPQKHPAAQADPTYKPKTGTAIALPQGEHGPLPTQKGPYTGTMRDLLAKDMRDLRNRTNAPNSSIKKIIAQEKARSPKAYKPPKRPINGTPEEC